MFSGYSGGIGFGLYGGYVSYGSLKLSASSPPQSFIEPLTLAEVKAYLQIQDCSPVDTTQDDMLSALISGAREQAEILQGRDLVLKQFDRTMDYWLNYRIELREPLVAVQLVQYKDSAGTLHSLTENTDYAVDSAKSPGLIVPMYNTTWPSFTPWPSSAVTIRFTSGYAANDVFWSDAGARIKIGMKMLINAWFYNRLPFEKGITPTSEYPYAVTSCLSYGSLVTVV